MDGVNYMSEAEINLLGGWNTLVTSELAVIFCDIAVVSTHRSDPRMTYSNGKTA